MLCGTSVSINNTPACYCLRMCVPSFFTTSWCLYFLSICGSVLWLSVSYDSPLWDHTFLKTVLDLWGAIDVQCDGVYGDGWLDEIYQEVQRKAVSYIGKLRSSSSWGSPVQWMLLPWGQCLLPSKTPMNSISTWFLVGNTKLLSDQIWLLSHSASAEEVLERLIWAYRMLAAAKDN